MKATEMRDLLARENIRLTKSLGQSFLHDRHQLERIVAAAALSREDRVVEIGPGLGPLTELLIREAGAVLAIEKDHRLVELLRARLGAAGDRGILQLVHDDALELIRRDRRDWSDWKLVANLPYSVASPILVELARGAGAPGCMVVTLQLEVAKRLMAKPGSKDYGVLTLLVQLDFEPRGWFKIPAGCFFPVPNVDSACVTLARRVQLPLSGESQRAVFRKIVKRAFSQRRKMMLKLLKADWPLAKLEAAFAATGIGMQARAESVSLERFVDLARRLSRNDSIEKSPHPGPLPSDGSGRTTSRAGGEA